MIQKDIPLIGGRRDGERVTMPKNPQHLRDPLLMPVTRDIDFIPDDPGPIPQPTSDTEIYTLERIATTSQRFFVYTVQDLEDSGALYLLLENYRRSG